MDKSYGDESNQHQLVFKKPVSRKNGSLRKQFKQWKLPQPLIDQLVLTDGDKIEVSAHFGNLTQEPDWRTLVSGCEIHLKKAAEEALQTSARARPGDCVEFRVFQIERRGSPKKNHGKDSANGSLDPEPNSKQEAARRIDVSIKLRQGQPEFRNELLKLYGYRCVISGCDCLDALEAAHIKPYNGRLTNVLSNGLLLRADLHTLFDRHLIRIDRNRQVRLDKTLLNTVYREFEGNRLNDPTDPRHAPKFT